MGYALIHKTSMHADWYGAHVSELLYQLESENFLSQFFPKSGRIRVVYATYYLHHSYIIYTYTFTYNISTYRDSLYLIDCPTVSASSSDITISLTIYFFFYFYSYLINKSIELGTLPIIFFRLEGHVTRRNFLTPLRNEGRQPCTF